MIKAGHGISPNNPILVHIKCYVFYIKSLLEFLGDNKWLWSLHFQNYKCWYFLTHTRGELGSRVLLPDSEGPLETSNGSASLVIIVLRGEAVASVTTNTTEDWALFVEIMAHQTTVTRALVFCDVLTLMFSCNHSNSACCPLTAIDVAIVPFS